MILFMILITSSLVSMEPQKNLTNMEYSTLSNRSYITKEEVVLKDYIKPVYAEDKHVNLRATIGNERIKKRTRDIIDDNMGMEGEKYSVNSTFNLGSLTKETTTDTGISFQDTINDELIEKKGHFAPYEYSSNRPTVYNKRNVTVADKIMLGDFKPSIGRIRESYPEISVPRPTSFTINSSFAYPYGSRTLKHDHSNVDKRMADFQDDLSTLKVKYPELMDLSNDYPIIEEIMIQKVEEKLMQYQHAKNLGKLNFLFEFAKSKPPGDPRNHYPNYAMSYKPVRQTDKFISKQPYPFYPPSFHDVNDQAAKPTSSSAASVVKPGSSLYAESLLGELMPYPHLKEDDFYYSSVSTIKPSPLKKALNILTAFIPVGLLLSALTPNILNINSTENITPMKQQRSIDKSYGLRSLAAGSPNYILDAINKSIAADKANISEGCRERITCEIVIFSHSPGIQGTTSTVNWFFKNISKLLLDTKRGGMIKQAVQNDSCTSLACDNEKVVMSIMALKSTTGNTLK